MKFIVAMFAAITLAAVALIIIGLATGARAGDKSRGYTLYPVSWWQAHQPELRQQIAWCRQFHPDIVSNPNCATAMSAMAGRK